MLAPLYPSVTTVPATGKRVFRDASTDSTARLLSSLLTEIDGLESSQRVVVIGATNRPKAIDAALVR